MSCLIRLFMKYTHTPSCLEGLPNSLPYYILLLSCMPPFQIMKQCAWECASENMFWVCRKTNLRRNGHGNSHPSCGILKAKEACTAVPCLMLLFQKQSLIKNVSVGSRIVILCFEALGTKSRQTQLSCQR